MRQAELVEQGALRPLRFVTDPIYGDHLRGTGHPESPARVEVVAARLRDLGAIRDPLRATDAPDEAIERVHTAPYLELCKRETAALRRSDGRGSAVSYLSTGDVMVDQTSFAVPRRAAGGALRAMEAAVESNQATFALTRPPGHHAERDRGMGFCLFNNAAIAARAFQDRSGGRVLVVDFDYHHGNGTEAVAGDGLSYVSTHAFPAYPGTGRTSYRKGADAVVNVPLPVTGVSTEAFVGLWEELLPRVAAAVRPDMLVVSAGFDYVAGDPVGDLGVDVSAAAWLAGAIGAIAAEYCGGRVAYVLEGGYDIDALTRSIAAVASVHDAEQTAPSSAQPRALPESVRVSLDRALTNL